MPKRERADRQTEEYRSKQRDRQRKRREENREEYNRKMREWQKANRDKIREQVKERRKNWTPEQRAAENARKKKWADANRATIKEAYRKKHGEPTRLLPGQRTKTDAKLANKKATAIKKGLKFDLTREWYDSFKMCAVTGREFGKGPWKPEIDRIIPGGDYTQDNCRLVCAIFNRCRMQHTDKDVLEFCKLMVKE